MNTTLQSGAVAGAVDPVAVVVAAIEIPLPPKRTPELESAYPPVAVAAIGVERTGVVVPNVTDPETTLNCWM